MITKNANRWRLCALALTILTCAPAIAQTIVGRDSLIKYNSLYGAGPVVFTPMDETTDSSIVTSDAETLQFDDEQSGYVLDNPERPWSTDVFFHGSHEYSVLGPPDIFHSILASGVSDGAASASGEGLATITSQTPGNRVILYFNFDSDQIARILGHVSRTPDGFASADVVLERFNGKSWGFLFWSALLPGGQGDFDQILSLPAGQYRVIGALTINAFAGFRPSEHCEFQFRLNVGTPCVGDLDGDDDVDIADLAALLSNYGQTGGATFGEGDIDRDGVVGLADLSLLLGAYGRPCD